jgi:hypothetical protein
MLLLLNQETFVLWFVCYLLSCCLQEIIQLRVNTLSITFESLVFLGSQRCCLTSFVIRLFYTRSCRCRQWYTTLWWGGTYRLWICDEGAFWDGVFPRLVLSLTHKWLIITELSVRVLPRAEYTTLLVICITVWQVSLVHLVIYDLYTTIIMHLISIQIELLIIINVKDCCIFLLKWFLYLLYLY